MRHHLPAPELRQAGRLARPWRAFPKGKLRNARGSIVGDKLRKGSETMTPSTGPHQFTMPGWISCAPFERLLNIAIVEASDGQATLTMPFLIDFAQGGGLMHGGALVGLADTAVVMAIKSVVPPQTHFATISLETKFLYPVKAGVVTAKAQVVKREGQKLVGEATVYDESDRPVMAFSSTFKIAKDTKIRKISYEKQ
jgi:acyl-CoA thioesterase